MVNARKYIERKTSEHEIYSKEELNEMIEKSRNGDQEARDEIILSHMRMVHKAAYGLSKNSILGKEDLVGYGVLGLIRALEKFDPEVGAKFSTYARNWIKSKMVRESQKFGNTIRVPIYKHENALYGDEKEKEDAEKDIEMSKTASLDKKRGVEGSTNMYNLHGVNDVYFEDLKEDKIRTLLELVTNKERFAMVRYFGIFGMRDMTLREIAKTEGVSHQAIEARLKKAKRRIKEAVENGAIKVD